MVMMVVTGATNGALNEFLYTPLFQYFTFTSDLHKIFKKVEIPTRSYNHINMILQSASFVFPERNLKIIFMVIAL